MIGRCCLPGALVAVLAGMLLTPASAVTAQDATVTATVFVAPEGYDVVGTDDLSFGILVPGQPSVVDPDDGEAGRWEAGDFDGAIRLVELTIHTSSLENESVPGAVIDVDWNGDHALVRSLTTDAEKRWNPTGKTTIQVGRRALVPGLGVGITGEYGTRVEVFIGGRIDQELDDASAGTYSGVLRLTVADVDG